jgi:ferrous iron transport protein A
MIPNNTADPPTLADLPRLGGGLVREVIGDDAVADRLRELGFTPGTPVQFVRLAPLGDPLCFRLRGTELCLRRREAARVTIRPDGQPA